MSDKHDLHITVQKDFFRGYSLLIDWYEGRNGPRKVATDDFNTYEVPDGMPVDKPTMMLNADQAQLLMDSLWEAGVRPADGAGSAGAMLRTEKHLEDMRALAFQSLKVKPPESKK